MQKQLGKIIRKYRNKKDYTINQLADELNISVGLLSNIETGKTDSFQLTLLNNIVKKLDIPLSELKLFSNKYPLEKLNLNFSEDLDKIKPSVEKLIEAFTVTASIVSFDKNKIDLITNILVQELETINKLIKATKSK